MLLADLPEEILHHIFSNHFSKDNHSLALLASLSKRFNRIATPILYSHVTLGVEDGDESRKVRRFVMSVFSNPYLAQCVRSLELNALPWVSHQSLSRRRKDIAERNVARDILGRPDRLDMFKLAAVVRRLPLVDEHKRHWCSELQESSPSLDALIALAFVFLPDLSRLESNWSSNPIFIWRMLPETYSSKVDSKLTALALRNLTHLKVNSEFPCGNSSEILPFFQMPSLAHFFGSNWGPIRRDGWFDGAENGTVEDPESDGKIRESPIVHLELRHCSIDSYSLQTIVQKCLSVRTFILHRDWDPRLHVRLPADSITKALHPLRGTLENIALSFEPGIYIHQEGEVYPLDFSHFPVLTNLSVAVGYIMHDPQDFDPPRFSQNHDSGSGRDRLIDVVPLHDRLPESLEVLRIGGFSTQPQMQYLIDDCCRLLQRRSQFPRLRELWIEASFDEPDSAFDTRALRLKAHSADVRLRGIDNTEIPFRDTDDLHTNAGYNWGMNGEFKWATKLF
ncbi:uncharacterized protein BJX67DRAFT_285440 [Aspergillus lucknowensis]|uniref:F-box domain-containing protein n=1 Tax=Aspergillus lucknowensis TaxID=176173 RepID=A0ABR4M0X8_9EURO